MKLLVNLFELRIRHVGVDLCGRDGGVTEELLDGADIGTVGEECSGEGMSERMSRDILDDISPQSVLFDLVGDKKPTQTYVFIL